MKKPFLHRKWQGLLNRIGPRYRHLKWKLHVWLYPISYIENKVPLNGIPIIINNFNRLDLLKQQIDWLQTLDGYSSILIVDNDSHYEPLLAYYKQLSDHPNIQVVFLGHNSWRKGAAHLAKLLLKTHPKVIITDPDLLPYADTPKDIISYLSRLMDKLPTYNHIGLSLEINDLPDYNPLRERIIAHESQFWKQKALDTNERVFIAPIDTTFAIYHQSSVIEAIGPALRTDRPYTLQHVDWYRDPEEQNPEFAQYVRSAKIFATWATELKKMSKPRAT